MNKDYGPIFGDNILKICNNCNTNENSFSKLIPSESYTGSSQFSIALG